jgi:aryl sulfotransferase
MRSQSNVRLQRRVYRNHSLDSARWHHYVPRHDDLVVASSYKSGTTWVQTIVLRLLLGDLVGKVVPEFSALEAPFEPVSSVLDRTEAPCGRRVIKTHLALDGLCLFASVRYVVVCRDARDVFMSLWNHYRNVIRYPVLAAPTHPGRHGPPLPKPPSNIRQFWLLWMTRGWFGWEREGYPFWGNLRHTHTWWTARSAENVLFVHYADLLTNTEEEISRIARFIGREVDRQQLHSLATATSFEQMRFDREQLLPAARRMFRGGAKVFFHRGTSGQWRGVLHEDDLTLYDAAATAELSPACREWLESGRAQSGIDPATT